MAEQTQVGTVKLIKTTGWLRQYLKDKLGPNNELPSCYLLYYLSARAKL